MVEVGVSTSANRTVNPERRHPSPGVLAEADCGGDLDRLHTSSYVYRLEGESNVSFITHSRTNCILLRGQLVIQP